MKLKLKLPLPMHNFCRPCLKVCPENSREMNWNLCPFVKGVFVDKFHITIAIIKNLIAVFFIMRPLGRLENHPLPLHFHFSFTPNSVSISIYLTNDKGFAASFSFYLF